MIDQIAITVFSCLSIYLFSTKEYYKFGFIAGLLGQPFWIYTSWTNMQWGVLFASIWFTLAHIRGIQNHWVKK